MYSGFVISSKHASNWVGAHQKFNRVAFRAMKWYLLNRENPAKGRASLARFPSLKLIQHFEGPNGPDGIKIKSPAQDEPWHYYDPYNPNDNEIFKLLDEHSKNLTQAISDGNEERGAFEAAWLAHAIADGLTPAHHFPYEEVLEELRGEAKETRDTKLKKLFIKGENAKDTIMRNWRMLGSRGVLTTHINFEIGVASALLPLRITHGYPTTIEMEFAKEKGLNEVFKFAAKAVADTKMYERYRDKGWTGSLTKDLRMTLAPMVVKTVSIAWLLALEQSKK